MKDSVTLLFFSILLQAPFCNASNPTQQNIDRARRLERRTQVREQQMQQQADQQEREFARRALAGISDPADDDRPENNADEAMYRRNILRMHVMSRDPNFWEFPFVIQEFILDRIIAEIEAQEAREQAPIKKMDEVSKRSLQGRWLAWLQGKAFSTSNNPETACCICLEEGDAKRALGYLPCDNLHPDVICLDCLSTVMANPHDDDAGYAVVCCPLCKGILDF